MTKVAGVFESHVLAAALRASYLLFLVVFLVVFLALLPLDDFLAVLFFAMALLPPFCVTQSKER